MEIIANDMPQYGVMIHVPESPGFRDRLFALVEVPPELEEDALRYSVVVENQTPQHILRINLVWSPYSQEDSKYVREYDPRDRNEYLGLSRGGLLPIGEGAGISIDDAFTQMSWGVSRGLIKAGNQCPWSLLEGSYFWRQKAILATTDARQEDRRDQLKARLAANARWSVGVDGVLFGDGVFAGPDTAMWFNNFETQVRAARDLIAELNRKLDAGEDVLAHAEQCASITIEQIDEQCASIAKGQIEAIHPTAISYERIYALTRKTTAKNVIARQQKSGEQAAVEWIWESAKSQIPLVRR
ncbi:MAG TPA: hypothetical protein VKG02_06855 [Blastocatellia bacterium]|nr:hypothetical protein [Blastocatellia bacterium]